MNDDEFEKNLHALTGALHRPDPTPAWKSDILARARREAEAIPFKRTLPPRWLMFGWAAAWVAILVMDFTAPSNPAPETTHSAGAAASNPGPTGAAPADSTALTLFAFHRRMNLNLELP
jgi:hypothetical protein